MSAEVTVQTKFATVSELAEGFASRVHEDQLTLRFSETVAEGEPIEFSVLLEDGMLAFGGTGLCSAVIDKGEDSKAKERYELVVDSLAFDEPSRAVFEHLLTVRAALFGTDMPPADVEVVAAGSVAPPPYDEPVDLAADEVEALPEDIEGDEDEYVEAEASGPHEQVADHDASAAAPEAPEPDGLDVPPSEYPESEIEVSQPEEVSADSSPFQMAPEGEFEDDPHGAATRVAGSPRDPEAASSDADDVYASAEITYASEESDQPEQPIDYDRAPEEEETTYHGPEAQRPSSEEDVATLPPPAPSEEQPVALFEAASAIEEDRSGQHVLPNPFQSQLPPGAFLSRPVAPNSWIPQAPPPMPPRPSSGVLLFMGTGLPRPARVPRPDLEPDEVVAPAPHPSDADAEAAGEHDAPEMAGNPEPYDSG